MKLIITTSLWLIGAAAYLLYVGGGLSIGTVALTSGARSAYASWQQANAKPDPARFVVDAGRAIPDYEEFARRSTLSFIPDWNGTDRISILLMGLDQRDEERLAGVPTRSDTMSVLSIDPVTKSAALISFPRDLWVTIPGLGEQRINEAYPYGELRKVDGGGPGLAARTLEQNFGLRVNHYALVNFAGFENLIDMLGGIVIDVPRPLADDAYPTEDYGIQRIYFAPGPQVMNGNTALKYARTRHADSDFGRMNRQQQVLRAMADRAMKQNLIARLPSLIDQGTKAISTDFTPAELASLGKLATQVDVSSLVTLEITYPMVRDFRGANGAALLLPDRAAIRSAIQRAFEPPLEGPPPAVQPPTSVTTASQPGAAAAAALTQAN